MERERAREIDRERENGVGNRREHKAGKGSLREERMPQFRNRDTRSNSAWAEGFRSVHFLVAAQAGEVLLVDGNAGGGAGTTTAATGSSSGSTTTGSTASGAITTTSRAVTTASRAIATTGSAVTTTAATAATGTGGSRAGLLNEAHVDVKVVLLLALLLALGLLRGALDVSLGLLVLQLLGASPLLVLLGALVGGTDGLGSEAVLSSLLSQVVGVGLGLVGLLNLLGGGLGLVLIGLGDGLANTLVVPSLLTRLTTPALLDLLAGVSLASAGLAVATATVAAAGAGGLLGLIGGLLAVVGAAGVAVTESGIVAAGHTATTAASVLTGLGGGSLLGSITLANAGSGTVDSLGGGRRGSVRVELGVIAKKLIEVLGPDVRHDAWFYEGPSGGRLSITAAIR
jgi:hypothetical protein